MRCWKGAGQGVCGFPTKGVGGHVTCGALSQRRDQDPRGKAQTRWWCGPLTPVGHVLSLRLMPARPRGFVPGLQSRAPLPRTSGCQAGGVWRRRPRYQCSAAARPPSPLLSPESRPLACSAAGGCAAAAPRGGERRRSPPARRPAEPLPRGRASPFARRFYAFFLLSVPSGARTGVHPRTERGPLRPRGGPAPGVSVLSRRSRRRPPASLPGAAQPSRQPRTSLWAGKLFPK